MKASELNHTKLELINWISNLTDGRYISLINSFRISNSENDFWNDLSEKQKAEIDLGIKQLDSGEGISLEDFHKKNLEP